jgi:transposase-like protein
VAFLERPLEGDYVYLWLDAKVEKVRDGGRVRHKALVIAHSVHETGRREVLGLAVGAAETEAFWTEFIRSLVARGLTGVQLVISDAHPGLKAAIARVLGTPWQRCTVLRLDTEEGRTLLVLFICYEDSLIKRDGTWRFAERKAAHRLERRRPSQP